MWRRRAVVALGAAALLISCNARAPEPLPPDLSEYSLRDDIEDGNSRPPTGLDGLTFKDGQGRPFDLRQFRGKKHVVLVVTRGFPGYICPYCNAQTSSLIRNYEEFRKRGAEVLVVFPGSKEHVAEFIAAVRAQVGDMPFPFPLLLDEDLSAVDDLGIRGDQAKPSTYIITQQGQIHFAHVGTSRSDRPSVKVLLRKLDDLAGR